MEQRYIAASNALAWLLRQKLWAYSPIVHCHELAKMHSLPVDHLFWQEYDFYMISKCDKFVILRIDGYVQSKGVAAEKAEAERLFIPVEFL